MSTLVTLPSPRIVPSPPSAAGVTDHKGARVALCTRAAADVILLLGPSREALPSFGLLSFVAQCLSLSAFSFSP